MDTAHVSWTSVAYFLEEYHTKFPYEAAEYDHLSPTIGVSFIVLRRISDGSACALRTGTVLALRIFNLRKFAVC